MGLTRELSTVVAKVNEEHRKEVRNDLDEQPIDGEFVS